MRWNFEGNHFCLSLRHGQWKKLGVLLLACAISLTLNGCGAVSSAVNSVTGSTSKPNFTTTVFVGDSLTAGYQNGSLLDTQQPHGYANLIAQQANFPLVLPLIAAPGVPDVLMLISLGPPPVIQPSTGITTGRDNINVQATDLAVPGAYVHDVITRLPIPNPASNEDLITTLVLGFPGIALGTIRTQEQWAVALKPTTIFIWVGNNDALVADGVGVPSAMTPLNSFTTDFTALMTALSQQTSAHLVVGNIPDVTLVPYLTPAATVIANGATQSGLSAAVVSQKLGIQAGDLVNPTGMADVTPILSGQQAGPITDAGFLSAAEVTQVQQMVDSYNVVIQQEAQVTGATLVDIHALFGQLASSGITINGTTANFTFLGGIFGLDGLHPTNTGYALLANKFIDTLNADTGTTIPDVNMSAVATADPLFPPNQAATAGHARTMPMLPQMPSAAGQHLDWMMRPQ